MLKMAKLHVVTIIYLNQSDISKTFVVVLVRVQVGRL